MGILGGESQAPPMPDPALPVTLLKLLRQKKKAEFEALTRGLTRFECGEAVGGMAALANAALQTLDQFLVALGYEPQSDNLLNELQAEIAIDPRKWRDDGQCHD